MPWFVVGACRLALGMSLASGVLLVASGCARSSERFDVDGSSVDAGSDAGRIGRRDGGRFEPDSPFAYDAYRDPGCDAGVLAPPPPPQCDPYVASTCAPGEGCYPYTVYPEGSCGEEQYSAFCALAGFGMQGDHCLGGTDCAAGFHCFVTGEGTQCLKLCDQTRIPPDCPRGRICGATDLLGYGACY